LEVGTEKISVCCFFDRKIWFDWLDFQREPEIAKKSRSEIIGAVSG